MKILNTPESDKFLRLQRLIYGMTNKMPIVSSEPVDVINEIELIRSESNISGFVLIPAFANSINLSDYTKADYEALFYHYCIHYEFSFIALKPEYSQRISDSLKKYQEDSTKNFQLINKDDKKFDIELDYETFIKKIITDIAESKVVLREHQIQIIKNAPISYLEEIYQKSTFNIKEIEILFAKMLFINDSNLNLFTDPDQLVRFSAEVFGNTEVSHINKNSLKDITLNITTSNKKKLLKYINQIPENRYSSFKKYQQFWKRLLKQCRYTDEKTLNRRFNNYKAIRDTLYGTISTNNSEIEAFKREGRLDQAFIQEMKNPGQMLRNFLFYLRYQASDTYASKANKIQEDKQKVQTDISTPLDSVMLQNTLLKCNPKLLWQLITLIDDSKWHKDITQRVCNKTKINYSSNNPLPRLKPELVSKAKKAIRKALSQIKINDNKKLGKVYIAPECDNHMMQFSGRADTSISLSGEYLTPGSIINIDDLLNKSGIKDPLIRLGVAWRGESCDLDHSLNINGVAQPVYYGKPILKNINSQTIISSSGDIRHCNKELFSVELIDIDLEACKEAKITNMFNSVIMYSGKSFNNYEVLWFLNIIDKKDRVLDGSTVQMKLDSMQYAIQITEESKHMIGLLLNVDNNTIEVINLPTKSTELHSNARLAYEDFNIALQNRPELKSIKSALQSVISKDQLTESKSEAQLIIDPNINILEDMSPGSIWLHPARDQKEIYDILY